VRQIYADFLECARLRVKFFIFVQIMHGMTLSRMLSIPLIMWLLVGLYITWQVDTGYALYNIVPPVVLLAMIYVLSPQIDWQWYKRTPPDLPGVVREMLFQYPFYQGLPEGEKKRFRQRVALFAIGNEYIAQGMEKVPDDLKYMIAACAATLTLGQEKFLFRKFEHIIVTPRPVPTPQYPDRFHASEIYEPDGVVLFAAEQLALGFMQSKQYFNIGLYEYAKIYVKTYPEANYPNFQENNWAILERISGFSRAWIEQWINRPDLDPLAVGIVYFFTFPDRFVEELPTDFQLLKRIFHT
jgi:Mlc titration factor MtfA (ptsG expression regulator)